MDTRSNEMMGLSRRLKGLIAFRLVFSSVLLFFTLIFRSDIEGAFPGAPYWAFLLITSGHLLVALLFYLMHRRARFISFAVSGYLQTFWDIVFATVLVYITGGIESPFKLLYGFPIAFGAIILFNKGAYSAAFLGALLYGALVNTMYFGWVPVLFDFVDIAGWEEERVRNSIGLNALLFIALAYGFSYVARLLRQTETILEEKSADLEDLEVLMGRIVESLTSGLVTLGPTGRVSFWSRAAEEITGLREKQVRGKTFWEIFPGSKEHLADFSNGDKYQRPWRWEMGFETPKDGTKVLGLSIAPLRHHLEGSRGNVVIFQDLTRFHEMEEKVKQADRMAAIGELAARIAHEIRNPLTSVSGAIEVLQGNVNVGREDKRLMDIVVRETERLNHLLSDFLTFARPTPPNFEEVDVSQIVAETTELFSKSNRNEKIKVVLKLKNGLSARVDPKRISQMVWNLMKNGAEAMPDGGTLTLSVEEDPQKAVLIQVSDEGTGISEVVKKEIFEPFFTTKPGGTGLGLAMVQQIASEHNAEVSVENCEPYGTVFKVFIPHSSPELNSELTIGAA